jgi:GNAT superfamily N-acetyltransferase
MTALQSTKVRTPRLIQSSIDFGACALPNCKGITISSNLFIYPRNKRKRLAFAVEDQDRYATSSRLRNLMEGNAKRSLLARFDAEMRIDPPAEAGFRFERSNAVLRAMGPYHWIVWWTFDAGQCDHAVRCEARTFQAAGSNVEWKIYGHDAPSNLASALERHGFVADDPETLMVLDDLSIAGCEMPEILPTGFELQRVQDEQGLGDFVSVTAQGFAQDASWMMTALPPQLFVVDAHAAAFVARVDGRPVGGGRLECPPGRSFASLWGGTTIAEFRGHGVYRALVAARVLHARRAGYPYLLVEARESSRPILEGLGFIPLTTVVCWNLKAE